MGECAARDAGADNEHVVMFFPHDEAVRGERRGYEQGWIIREWADIAAVAWRDLAKTFALVALDLSSLTPGLHIIAVNARLRFGPEPGRNREGEWTFGLGMRTSRS